MTTAKNRYQELVGLREDFLTRARDCAALTIPSLMPPAGHAPGSKLPEPNQGLGARLVVHLANHFTSALLPPGRQVFRLGVTPEALLETGQPTPPPEFEAKLSLIERIPHGEIGRRRWRTPTNMSLQHLIVTGNVMEQMLPDNSIAVHTLDRFVVVRDPSDNLVEFIVEQVLSIHALPAELEALRATSTAGDAGVGKTETLYTWGKLEGDQWVVHQEFAEQEVPDSKGYYDKDKLPFFHLRWASVAGEDYGRSKVGEHLPDLRTFDGLSKSMRDGAAMASRNITMIRPNAQGGFNLRRKVSKAENGDTVIGNPEDVSMLQFQNASGLQIVQVELETLRRELGAAFMLTSSLIRDAERVTASEVQRVSQELDSVQGGAFSMLSQDMMAPRLRRLLFQMQQKKQLPEMPEDAIDVTILTGLEAMGREAEASNVMQGLQVLQATSEESQEYVKWPVVLKKAWTAFDLADAVKSDEEVMADRQQRQQQTMAEGVVQSAAAPVAQAVAQAATE